MKEKTTLSIVFAIITSLAFGQTYPLVKVHAYSQATLAGAKPGGVIEEGGNEIKTVPSEKFNYFFYAEYRPQFKFTLTGIWIKGKRYGVKKEPVLTTPVTINADPLEGSAKTTLVPATTHKVIYFYPAGLQATGSKPTAWLKNLLETADLVIKYQWKGKTWYYAVKKINMLNPVAGS
jgi:hypothetical protein